MSFQREVYNLPQVLLMTSIFGIATGVMYATRESHPEFVWFIENWGVYIGITITGITFLSGLTLIGKPIYSEETNKRLEAEHNREKIDWYCKSPEERAIIEAARRNESLQLTQILQNNTIIGNQDELKRKRSY